MFRRKGSSLCLIQEHIVFGLACVVIHIVPCLYFGNFSDALVSQILRLTFFSFFSPLLSFLVLGKEVECIHFILPELLLTTLRTDEPCFSHNRIMLAHIP